jgi:hypothetical protein
VCLYHYGQTLYRWTAIPRLLHNTMAVLNSTGTSGYERKEGMGTVKISEHYEVDMNTHVLNYKLAYTYLYIHAYIHTLTPILAHFSPSFLFSLLSNCFIISCVYCLYIFSCICLQVYRCLQHARGRYQNWGIGE